MAAGWGESWGQMPGRQWRGGAALEEEQILLLARVEAAICCGSRPCKFVSFKAKNGHCFHGHVTSTELTVKQSLSENSLRQAIFRNLHFLCYKLINVKKTYQFKTHCKDDAMISLH